MSWRLAPTAGTGLGTMAGRLAVSAGRVARHFKLSMREVGRMPRGPIQGQLAVLVDALARLRDVARRHPMRLAILALLASKRRETRSLAGLRTQLPQKPLIALVAYHARVLCQLELIRCQGDIEGVVYALA